MKYLIAVVFVLLAGCGQEELCQDSDLRFGGLCIQKGFDISESDVDALVAVTEKYTALHYPEVINIRDTFKKEKVRVEFIDGNLAMNCKKYERDVYECENYIGGVNYEDHFIYVSYDSCLANTSLVHELIHSIELFYLDADFGRNDKEAHNAPWLFVQYMGLNPDVSYWDIVEVIANVELACTLGKCSSDYAESELCTDLWPELNKTTEPENNAPTEAEFERHIRER